MGVVGGMKCIKYLIYIFNLLFWVGSLSLFLFIRLVGKRMLVLGRVKMEVRQVGLHFFSVWALNTFAPCVG